MPNDQPFRDIILGRLPPEDRALLEPHLKREEMPLRRRLAEPNRPIERVYFPEAGLASVVTNIRTQRPIEIGIIGREGVVNLPAMMGTDRSPNETFIQVEGFGFGIDAERVREAMDRSPAMSQAVAKFAYVYMEQIASTVLANGRASVTERLARWLLMCHDRLDGDTLSLTHEFPSVMLGVRRSGVTVAMQTLKRQGLIRGGRGFVEIVSREGLEATADGYYGIAEAEVERLFGPWTLP
jgi:CRP-like cAMP-binding protein